MISEGSGPSAGRAPGSPGRRTRCPRRTPPAAARTRGLPTCSVWVANRTRMAWPIWLAKLYTPAGRRRPAAGGAGPASADPRGPARGSRSRRSPLPCGPGLRQAVSSAAEPANDAASRPNGAAGSRARTALPAGGPRNDSPHDQLTTTGCRSPWAAVPGRNRRGQHRLRPRCRRRPAAPPRQSPAAAAPDADAGGRPPARRSRRRGTLDKPGPATSASPGRGVDERARRQRHQQPGQEGRHGDRRDQPGSLVMVTASSGSAATNAPSPALLRRWPTTAASRPRPAPPGPSAARSSASSQQGHARPSG